MLDSRDVNSWRLGKHLTEEQKAELRALLFEEPSVWAWNDAQIGRTSVQAHTIDTGDTLPLKQRAYRLAPAEDRIVDGQVANWLHAGVVVPSVSPWASPVVLAKKKPLDPNDPNEAPKF